MERLSELSTDALVTRARGGCRESFGHLVERHVKGVFNFLLQRTGTHEDAEELCQESFLRAWRKLDTYRDEWSFSTWVYSIARSVAADRARVVCRVASGTDFDQHAVESSDAHAVDDRDEGDELWRRAREILDADQHAALWLFYAEDRSASEIGRILGRSSIAVRLLLFRARSAMREDLERGAARATRTRTMERPRDVVRSASEPALHDAGTRPVESTP